MVIDKAIDSLAPSARKALLQTFRRELMATTLIYISGPEANDEFLHAPVAPERVSTRLSAVAARCIRVPAAGKKTRGILPLAADLRPSAYST